ncbi:hypothetical protein MJO29_008704, partial [Puccinia striiformis f. sp. tritici]
FSNSSKKFKDQILSFYQ